MTEDQQLTAELRGALDALAARVPFSDLQAAATRLSETYRRADPDASATAIGRDSVAALAYVATRMPATLASVRAVFDELKNRCPGLRAESLLDLGSGPATTLWAAASEFPTLRHASLVEPDPTMVALAQTLLAETSLGGRVDATWYARSTDLPSAEGGSYDVAVTGYLMTELDDEQRGQVLDLAWRACREAIVVILPGSTRGFRVMLDARAQLLSLGATVVAPCPHDGPCPLPADDWCHFAVRLNRSSLHRRLKRGALPYEDEKYCYVVGTRGLGAAASARVLSRPRTGNRRTTLRLCAEDGLRVDTVPHSDRTAYRRARKTRWGDAWESD